MIWRRRLRWGNFWWACDWLLVVGVVWGSLTPGAELPRAVNFFNDKALHASGYFLLTFWFAGSLERAAWPIIAVVFAALGGFIEILQYWMGFGRDADLYDFYADLFGIGVALLLLYCGLGGWMEWVERRMESIRS